MEGFKQTEIGWIPEDWEVKELSKLSSKIGDGIHSTPIYCNSSEYRFINGNNLLRGKIEYTENTEYISFREYVKYKKNLINNTILYSINGTIGNIAFYNGEKIVLGKSAAYINLKDIIHKDFVYYFLQSSLVLGYYRNELTGSTINNLSLSTLNNTPILLPPLPEQEAIAKALSDVDSLIDTLERKIAKKRNIKQGAMQRLLTGKQRLPGFSGDWVEKRLGRIGTVYNGLSSKRKEDFINGIFPYIPFMNVMANPIIDTKYIEYVNVASNESQNRVLKGDLLFNTSSETPEEVGMCSVLLTSIDDLYLNSFCFGFRLVDDLNDGIFLSYWFRSESGRILMSTLAQGATRYNLAKAAFLKQNIVLPPTKAEQSAIAQILTDMDNEITTLEQKLNKYKQIKQGMMQELLAGRIRLVKPQ